MPPPLETHSYRHLLIRASAGTGKTFQLSNRFLELLRHGVSHDRILATTFTRKAAGEILDRVILRLAQATQDEAKCRELANHTGSGPLTRAACLHLLEDAMRHLHRLRVSTLDSFFAQIARSFSLELGLPPGWQIVEEWDDARLRTAAIATILTQGDAAELRTLMNLLTKGEANRSVSELIRTTVQELYELYLEADAKAWHALPRYRPLDATELAAALEDLRTVELSGKRLVMARDQDYERACAGNWDAFLTTGLTAKVQDGTLTYFKQAIPAAAVAVYQRLIEHVRALLVGRVVLQTEATYDLLHRFHAEYQRLKQSHRALQFADVTRRLNSLAELATPERLAFRLDSRIDHLLLDEFQDTSPEQWRVLKPLAERLTAASAGSSFFCVGDVKQAIYGWRGGEAAIFDAIDRQLHALQRQSLSTSYRSAPAIIETVNRIFTRLPDHPHLGRAKDAVRGWCQAFEPHATKLTDLPGYVELASAPAAPEDQAQSAVTVAWAADKIAEIVAQTPGYGVGVLVRTNKTVGRLIYELRQRGVPASEEGGNPLTDSAAVLTILSALRLADHPADTVARFHLAHSPLAAVLCSPAARENWAGERGEGEAPAEPQCGTPVTASSAGASPSQRSASPSQKSASPTPSHAASAMGCAGSIDYRDDVAARVLAQRIRRALLENGYGPVLFGWAERLAPQCSRRELSRLEQLVELAYAYDQDATLRPDDFVRYVAQKRVSAASPADVRVMTIHQAKGLEFPIVFLPELEAGLIGQSDAFVSERADVTGPVQCVCRYANADIQALMPKPVQQMFEAATERSVTESLCVLYVALTRAVYALYAVIPPSKANERSLPNNFAGLLRLALYGETPVAPQQVLFQHGDPEWFRRSSLPPPSRVEDARRSLATDVPAPSTAAPVTIQLAPITGARRRGWERARPSGLEGGTRISTTEVLRAPRSGAFLRGQLIHAWFERVLWLDEGRPADAALRQAAQEVLAGAEGAELHVDEQLRQFETWLETPALAALLSRSRYEQLDALGFPPSVPPAQMPLVPTVQNERGFALRDGERLLTGYIDRLVLVHQGPRVVAAEIIDFKTDALRAGDRRQLGEKAAFYAPQMHAYRRAVAQFTQLPLEHILARLVFVEAGVVETVH